MQQLVLDMATITLCFMLLVVFLLINQLRAFRRKCCRRIGRQCFPPLPPGPRPWPVFGSLFQMFTNKPTYKWIHKIMNEMKTDIACICLGSVHVITVTSPELGREFLKKHDSIFSSRPLSAASEMTSSGYLSIILSPYGDQWRKMKRVLVSNMTAPAKYSSYSRTIFDEADHLVYYVFNQSKKNSGTGAIVNVRTAARHYSANVMKRMIFCKRFFGNGSVATDGGPGNEDEEHVDALFVIIAYLHSFSISDFLPCIKLLDLDGHSKIISRALRIVRKYHDREIDERILMWQKGLKDKEVDFLDVLLNLKDDSGRAQLMSIDEIKALILDLMLATVDNPSNAVEWALAEMINQPEILEKATKELDTVVGKERLAEEYDIPKLKYINACLMESFRLHPIAPFNVPHVSTEDAIVSGYFIPKGSHVVLSRLGIGRNSRVWVDEPQRFKPESHLKDGSSQVTLNDPDLNVFSFSTGRRGCPGVAIGSTMTTLMMARLVQGFTWTTPPGISEIDLTESKNDLLLRNPLLAFAKPRLATNLYPQY